MAVGGCGGGDDSPFDEDGLRSYIEAEGDAAATSDEVDQVVGLIREDCNRDESDVFWAGFIERAGEHVAEMMAIACPGVLPPELEP